MFPFKAYLEFALNEVVRLIMIYGNAALRQVIEEIYMY